MKDLLVKINESTIKEIKVKISLDDFDNDFYNVLSELMFAYNQVNKDNNITSEQVIKMVNKFFEK